MNNTDWEAVAADLTLDKSLLSIEIEKLKEAITLAKIQSSRKHCNEILENVIDNKQIDIDYYIANDLRENHRILITPDKDEGGYWLEPDWKTIESIEIVLAYYMPKKDFDEWFEQAQKDKIVLLNIIKEK